MAYAGTPVYDNPIFYYYHSDHLGSSNIMTDADPLRRGHIDSTACALRPLFRYAKAEGAAA